jgi:hypothetical protein
MNIDAWAREIAIRLFDAYDPKDVERVQPATDVIAAALLAARNEALEEAAGVAEAQKDEVEVPRSYEMAHVCIGMEMAATAIRALKEGI